MALGRLSHFEGSNAAPYCAALVCSKSFALVKVTLGHVHISEHHRL